MYAPALVEDTSCHADDLSEAATTLEDTERIARRVLGGAHPNTVEIEGNLAKLTSQLSLRALGEGDVRPCCRRAR